jgi:2-dehydropantoate 2-reductase
VRYVVYGAGAIGGVVGARLAEAGHDVTLIARGAHLEALRARGLRIESPEGSHRVRIRSVGHPGDVDWAHGPTVLLAVKSQQTANALGDLVPVAPPSTPVVCLQNGIANEAAALRFFSDVQAVCVMLPASHLEPGVVQAWSSPTTGMLDIGRFPRGHNATTSSVSADLAGATFSSIVTPEILRWKHRKLLTNLGNIADALFEADEHRRALVDMLTAEGEAVLAAAGRDVATREEDRARQGQTLTLGSIGDRTHQGGSTWQSLERRAGDIETDYLNGEIVRLGRMHGRPAPANQVVQELARTTVSAGVAPRSLRASTVLERLGVA